MNDYYLVRQVISNNLKYSFKVFAPLNLTHLQVLLEHLTGNLYVYLVNPINNSTKDLTSKLGRSDFNYHNFRSKHDQILKSTVRFSTGQSSWVGDYITFYSLDAPSAFFPENFFCNNHVTFPSFYGIDIIDLSELEKPSEKIHAGEEYEKFIGKKYETSGYKVEYRGLILGKQDGGIDLVAENDEKVVLVQCKNWIDINHYQIESRDLRAFLGDCYLYLLHNTINKPISYHYIISDIHMLSESSKLFLNQNTMIKAKEVRFKMDDLNTQS